MPVSGGSAAATAVRSGTVTLVAGEATVINASVTPNTSVLLTCQQEAGTPGQLRVASKISEVFVISSSSISDTSTVYWELHGDEWWVS